MAAMTPSGRPAPDVVALDVTAAGATGIGVTSPGAAGPAAPPVSLSPVRVPDTGGLVLVADDDSSVRALLRVALGSAGIHVVTAPDGVAALRTAEATHPHALVLDVMMPGMDGFAVARRVRRTASPPALLFLTARDSHEDRRLAADLCAGYITKPFHLTDLIADVRRLLRGGAPA